jgi:hypothetical protein
MVTCASWITLASVEGTTRYLYKIMVRSAANALAFYEYVTPRTFILAYLGIAIFLLGVTLPILGVSKWNALSQHHELAHQVAASLSGQVDAQIVQLYSAAKLLEGFAASAAPLQVPDYLHDSVATRIAVATRPGTAGALTRTAYSRILAKVSTMFNGFVNALVQPGVINVYAPNGSTTANGDWLNYTAAIRTEYFYMVNTTKDSIYGPQFGPLYNQVVTAVRIPVWSTQHNLSKNPYDFDSQTGWHVNWRNLWGGITVVLGLETMARDSNLDAIVGVDFDYLFEARPRSTIILPTTQYMIIRNTTHSSQFSSTIDDCANTPNFQNLCFRIRPKSGKWDGSDSAATLATAALLEIFVPFILLVALVALGRLILGPRPTPLIDAPLRTPFYAVCVDMVGAIKMWAEVPFIMNEITTVFSQQLDALAHEHRVFVALRLGNTVIVTSQQRSRVMRFSQAMNHWALSYKWPAHIVVHLPGGIVSFSFVLHMVANVVIRVDPATHSYEATGRDMQLLLLLRSAAVPNHVVCTAQYLGIEEAPRIVIRASMLDGIPEGDKVPHSNAKTSDRTSVEVTDLLKLVREIGTCEVPIEEGTVLKIRGFLVPSAGTGRRKLHEVMDSFPDWIWSEWRSAGHGDDGQSSDAGGERQNPFHHSFEGSTSTSVTRTNNNFKNSCTASIASSVRAVTRAHMLNLESAPGVPGSAIDYGEIRQLAIVVADTVTFAQRRNTFVQVKGRSVAQRDNLGHVKRMRELLSLASYFLVAFRTAFAPIEPESQKLVITKISTAMGLPVENYAFHLAARCARASQQYLRGAEQQDSPNASAN